MQKFVLRNLVNNVVQKNIITMFMIAKNTSYVIPILIK